MSQTPYENGTFDLLQKEAVGPATVFTTAACSLLVAAIADFTFWVQKLYFRSPWNKTDQLMFAMLGLAVIFRYTLTDDAHFEWIRNIYAVNLVMFYLRILQLFLVEKHLGPKIIMIRRMVTWFAFTAFNCRLNYCNYFLGRKSNLS